MLCHYNAIMWYRKHVRLKGYDYSQEGYYFITICTHFKRHLFGKIRNEAAELNAFGKIVELCWNAIPGNLRNVQTDAFVVMPNHIHGILHLTESGAASVPSIVQNFKSVSARRINAVRRSSMPVWQQNYYEHVIRKERALALIRLYIVLNPVLWAKGADLKDLNMSEEQLGALIDKFQPTLP